MDACDYRELAVIPRTDKQELDKPIKLEQSLTLKTLTGLCIANKESYT